MTTHKDAIEAGDRRAQTLRKCGHLSQTIDNVAQFFSIPPSFHCCCSTMSTISSLIKLYVRFHQNSPSLHSCYRASSSSYAQRECVCNLFKSLSINVDTNPQSIGNRPLNVMYLWNDAGLLTQKARIPTRYLGSIVEALKCGNISAADLHWFPQSKPHHHHS